MVGAIEKFFLEIVGRKLCVFFCSMIPIIELRGAIPLGAGLGLPWWQTFLLSVAGNILPVPFILLFIRGFIAWAAKSKISICNRFAGFLNRKIEKNRERIEKYSFWGVCLFVAIPLPMTGAWTGSLVAAALGMKFWRALLSCVIGVLIAGVVVTLISYGALAIFFS
ncbi:MAG: small multi-drug export protein [Clostridia bacterium]|nr:small multi-drug export protein [Clostridia bacterium]MBO7250359.1 small multi-drug export protein [Clostridia bacterium]